MKNMKKRGSVALVVCLMLAVCLISIGGTIAWLTDSTDPVVNTFSPSTVGLTLTETDAIYDATDKEYNKSFKMVPGQVIAKDPKVTVESGSEACWVFVKIEKSTNFDNYMEYTVGATGVNGVSWTQLKDAEDKDVAGVYYIDQAALTADVTYNVLADNKVTVKDDVTKAMMDGLTETTYPQLSFKAYAIQRASFDTAAAAWAELNPTNP